MTDAAATPLEDEATHEETPVEDEAAAIEDEASVDEAIRHDDAAAQQRLVSAAVAVLEQLAPDMLAGALASHARASAPPTYPPPTPVARPRSRNGLWIVALAAAGAIAFLGGLALWADSRSSEGTEPAPAAGSSDATLPEAAPAPAAGGGDSAIELQGLLRRTADVELVPHTAQFDEPGSQILEFTLQDAAGEPIMGYEIEATKPLHLIVVRDDLSDFQHLHPTLDERGRWSVEADFPRDGRYRMYADFIPDGATRLVLGTTIEVGSDLDAQAALPEPGATARSDGGDLVRITDTSFGVNANGTLEITVLDGGKPVTDLQPYLGELGHGVVVAADGLAYQHTHPLHSEATGPALSFMVNLSTAGSYRAFVQYKRDGRVHTVPFTLTAEEGATSSAKAPEGSSGSHVMPDGTVMSDSDMPQDDAPATTPAPGAGTHVMPDGSVMRDSEMPAAPAGVQHSHGG